MIESLEPVPFRVRFYLDSYGVQKVARNLADLSRESLREVIAERDRSGWLSSIVDFEVTPERLACLAEDCVRQVEQVVLRGIEAEMERSGFAIVTRRDLDAHENRFARASPFFSASRERVELANAYVDLHSDSVVFAPHVLDVSMEANNLREATRRSSSPAERAWVDSNLRSIEQGKLYYKEGGEIDFGFSQSFVSELAGRLGSASTGGRYKIRWGDRFTFGEKGVDCDLIVSAMDDLWGGEVEAFVFFTRDGDFAPLLRRIVSAGKRAAVCGLAGTVSRDLLDAVGGEVNFFDLGSPQFFSRFSGSEAIWLKDQRFETLYRLDQDYLMPMKSTRRWSRRTRR